MADSVKIKITGDASEFRSELNGVKGEVGSLTKVGSGAVKIALSQLISVWNNDADAV